MTSSIAFINTPLIFSSESKISTQISYKPRKLIKLRTIVSSASNFSFNDPFQISIPASSPSSSPSPYRVRNFPKVPITSPIKLLASDLDGTFLNAKKEPCAQNITAVLAAVKAGVQFIPATGKSRVGALRALGPLGKYLLHVHPGNCPGIFLNGLRVHGKDGVVIFERALSRIAARTLLVEAELRGLVVLFYLGDQVVVRRRNKETDMFIVSHEPIPDAVSALESIIDGDQLIHKALLVDPKGNVKCYRREMENVLNGLAEITQARPDVLEVVPVGSSKGEGFKILLEHLNVPQELSMAIGDGENDLDMIKEAGLGVVVSNAVPEMLNIADHVVGHHNDAAVAEAINKFIFAF